jgi:succinate dehydrogenase hydrophobic anchor subunit
MNTTIYALLFALGSFRAACLFNYRALHQYATTSYREVIRIAFQNPWSTPFWLILIYALSINNLLTLTHVWGDSFISYTREILFYALHMQSPLFGTWLLLAFPTKKA